jgi:hypothetical protein
MRAIDIESRLIAETAIYLEKLMPDALDHFGLTDEALDRLIRAYLGPDVLHWAKTQPETFSTDSLPGKHEQPVGEPSGGASGSSARQARRLAEGAWRILYWRRRRTACAGASRWTGSIAQIDEEIDRESRSGAAC